MGQQCGSDASGAAAHQDVVVPDASEEVLAAARSNRQHTLRRKMLRCVPARELKEKLCGEGVPVTE